MRLWVLFLVIAVAIGFDAIQNSGHYSKQLWAQARDAGRNLEQQIASRTADEPATTVRAEPAPATPPVAVAPETAAR
jgi:hypothetical protein